MDWSFIGSIFWKFSLGVLLLALTALAGYLCAAVGSFRNSLNSIRNTLNSVENMVNQEIGELITDVDKTVKVVNAEASRTATKSKRVDSVFTRDQRIGNSTDCA